MICPMSEPQTPAHEAANPTLLRLIPSTAERLIEVGCSSGALARDFKKTHPQVHYRGIEIDPGYTELARRHCDEALTLDIQTAPPEFWQAQRDRDCWVFGDVLEHLANPWAILKQVRSVIPPNGSVVACIPNMQHWSIQARLSVGDLRYEDSGLLDRTHIRWFTRQTIGELFNQAGFTIVSGTPRIFAEPMRDRFMPIIRAMAQAAGADPRQAEADAAPLQYVVVAQPT